MQPTRFSYDVAVLLLLFLTVWQNGSRLSGNTEMTLKKQTRVAIGNWGGPNVGLHVEDAGAQIQFPCAHGSINQPLILNEASRFAAKGTFVAETPGPLRENNPPKNQAALYNGTVRDKEMTLTVTLTETKQKIGTFTLKHGTGGRVRRCH